MEGIAHPAWRAGGRRHWISLCRAAFCRGRSHHVRSDTPAIFLPHNVHISTSFSNAAAALSLSTTPLAATILEWFKTIVGGAWDYGDSKFFEGDLSFYYLDHNNPITRDASNFDFDDEMYYDLDLMPEAHILAGTYNPDARNKHDGRNLPSVYDVSPQMWTYEKDNYRAFVSIPGHNYKSFDLPHYRAVLLRGIAWAGKRDATCW